MIGIRSRPAATRPGIDSAAAVPASDQPRPTWRRIWAIFGWLVTGVGIVWGMHELDTRVTAALAGRPCRLEWADLPTWLAAPASAQILGDIHAAADLRADDGIHDPDLVRRIGENLSRSPWVAQVKQVARLPDGRVRVQASFREPFAFIEVGGIAYLVDASGVRLPNKYFVAYVEERFWNDWLRITGVSGPVPEVGQPWTGENVAAGLKLVHYLKQAGARGEVPFRPALRAIDVSAYGGTEAPELRIRTVNPRGYIVWGLCPGAEGPIQPSAARKLDMLRAYYNDNGGQFPDGWIQDLRFPEGIRRWAAKG